MGLQQSGDFLDSMPQLPMTNNPENQEHGRRRSSCQHPLISINSASRWEACQRLGKPYLPWLRSSDALLPPLALLSHIDSVSLSRVVYCVTSLSPAQSHIDSVSLCRVVCCVTSLSPAVDNADSVCFSQVAYFLTSLSPHYRLFDSQRLDHSL